MSFYVRHRFGGNDRDPPLAELEHLLGELDDDPGDPEHVSVSVVHESDWALAAYPGGLVTFENVEATHVAPRHMRLDDRADVLRLMRAVAEGRIDEVMAAPWRAGYGGSGGR